MNSSVRDKIELHILFMVLISSALSYFLLLIQYPKNFHTGKIEHLES